MQNILIRFFLITTAMLAASFPLQAAETFTFDNQHSYVLWHIKHLGFSTQTGKWYVKKGVVILDKDQPQNSQVNTTIDVANMITGIPELDEHLKGEQFFDVARYPTATFKSDKIDILSDSTAKVHGILNVHGIAKPVVLTVKLNSIGTNPLTDRTTAGFSATTTIKRSDFGIKTLLPALGDDVAIEIGAEAYKPTTK